MTIPAWRDWTANEAGYSNSSAAFEATESAVERLIRDGAWTLINCGPKALAGTIVAQLAHVHGFAPQRGLYEAVDAYVRRELADDPEQQEILELARALGWSNVVEEGGRLHLWWRKEDEGDP